MPGQQHKNHRRQPVGPSSADDRSCLPTLADINVYDSLDERWAVGNFLGKTLAQAEELFRESAMTYQKDLQHMGPVAFRFYVPAFVTYLRSAASSGGSYAVNSFASLVRNRWESEPRELEPVRDLLADACRTVLAEWDRFGVDEAVYCGWSEGGLRGDYEALLASLTATSADGPAGFR
jgi:hypothetical protein